LARLYFRPARSFLVLHHPDYIDAVPESGYKTGAVWAPLHPVHLDSPLNLAGLNAGGADFQAANCLIDHSAHRLKVGHPAPFVMRIEM